MAFEKWEPLPEFERFPASATIVQSRLIRLPHPVASMLRLRGKVQGSGRERQNDLLHRHCLVRRPGLVFIRRANYHEVNGA